MTTFAKHVQPPMELDDLRDLMRSVSETTERLEATHVALQNQVQRLQRELSDANAQLQRSRSLAALGEMAAGIAHEIRNPLGSIQLYVQALAEDVRDQPEPAKLCGKIERAVVGLDAIVRDVLSFARDTAIHPRPTTAADLFERAVRSCETVLAGTTVDIECEPEQFCFEADAGLLVQVLGNLLRNAVEAMTASASSEAGRIEREIRLVAVRRTVRCPDGSRALRAVLAVEDNGPGIRPEVVKRMFNPFFTTRKTGTGLGLAIVHRIVDAHGGHIHVTSVRPCGTRIEICLPLQAAAQPGDERAIDSARSAD